jgi:adenylate cyclase
VNIAARLESLCQTGGICVSRNVYEHVVNELSVKFEDMGQLYVKNIPSPVHAYMIAPYGGDGEEAMREPPQDAARQRRHRVAVGAAIVVAMLAASIATAFQLHLSR